uniref:hypothetical protein n=1 Tax=Alistipes onderdonkii TaxID=328813 RepID=UPI004024BB8C
MVNYEDRNAIPAWVEKVTTPDEYAIWKTLSRYYRVAYSYANQRQATDAERKEVYERLKTLCERLESGELKVAPNETLQSSLRSAVCLIRSVLARLHARKNGFFSIRMSMGMMRI